jgi:hypothetical protein
MPHCTMDKPLRMPTTKTRDCGVTHSYTGTSRIAQTPLDNLVRTCDIRAPRHMARLAHATRLTAHPSNAARPQTSFTLLSSIFLSHSFFLSF